MKEFYHVLTQEEGIHTRPAGQLVKEAGKFESAISLICGEKIGDAKRIFTIMTLGAKKGEKITVRIEGSDEDIAATSLQSFFNDYL